jgi:hypothetical protein
MAQIGADAGPLSRFHLLLQSAVIGEICGQRPLLFHLLIHWFFNSVAAPVASDGANL